MTGSGAGRPGDMPENDDQRQGRTDEPIEEQGAETAQDQPAGDEDKNP